MDLMLAVSVSGVCSCVSLEQSGAIDCIRNIHGGVLRQSARACELNLRRVSHPWHRPQASASKKIDSFSASNTSIFSCSFRSNGKALLPKQWLCRVAAGGDQIPEDSDNKERNEESAGMPSSAGDKDAAIVETLATLGKTLEQLSATLADISTVVNATALAVQDAAAKLETLQGAVNPQDSRAGMTVTAESAEIRTNLNIEQEDSTTTAGKLDGMSPLAIRLQQAFYQARIYGLGKPLELALEDFVSACMEAAMDGIGLKDLQLQLILAAASLPQPFAPFTGDRDLARDEETRVRSMWVRLVYTTLHQVAPTQIPAADPGEDADQLMGMAVGPYVKEVLRMRSEAGYDLQKLKLEHSLSAGQVMPSVKLMREIHYLILLTASNAPAQPPREEQ